MRKVIGLVQFCRQWCQLLLDDISVVDVDVSYCLVVPLEKVDDSIKQFVESFAVLCHCGNHRDTHHRSQMLIVYLCTAGKQLVVHVERNNCAQVHVDKFCGEV